MAKSKKWMMAIGVPALIIIMVFLMSAGWSVSDTTGYDWYFQPNDTHTTPQVAKEVPLEGYSVLYCGEETEKKISITFDAGYDNGYHTSILDTLEVKGVSAAFFLDGNFVKQNGELVKRMAAEGHIVGNHTLNHADMTKLTDFATYTEQIEGWNALVNDLGLTPSGYFRFPCGRFSNRALDYNEKLGLTSVFWTFAYYDWVQEDQPTPEKALEKILSRMHNGCILLLHSTSATNAEILGTLIDRLRAEGYEIVSLEQLSAS